MSWLRRRDEPSPAEQIRLAASARARVELLIGQMEGSLGQLRTELLNERTEDDRRPDPAA